MNVERIRALLGVWAPMGIGLFIILTSVNFYFTAQLTPGAFTGNLESWRLVCSAGAFFVGGVLILSTFGRYRKTKEARRQDVPGSMDPTGTTSPHEARHAKRNRNQDGE